MEKRLIIAITLSVLILLIFQRFIQPPTSTQQSNESGQVDKFKPQSIASGPPSTVYRLPPTNEIETIFETDKFILTFTNIGGALKSIKLKEYDAVLVKDAELPYGVFSITSPQIDPHLNSQEFNMIKEPNKIIYEYSNPAKDIKIIKEFIFHKFNDYIELQLNIENESSTFRGIDYEIIGPSAIEPASEMKGRNFIEMKAKVDGKLLRKSRIRGEEESINGIVSWLALKNRYFTLAVKPFNGTEGIVIRQKNKMLMTGLKINSQVINPNSFIRHHYIFYIGPQLKERLAALNIGLEESVNYGFFGGISTFLLSILGGINAVVHNWGLSIIAVTLLINIILFPLTKKSFTSMRKMQEVQPHMEKLRQLHKDNPQKLNKEMVGLYKQYNVNPFGGCLPLFLQLPIFISFYQALMRSIELKNASFLWIKDLSSPDALFTFSQPLPLLGNNLNILPIVTAVLMFIQQKASTAQSAKHASSEMAKQQKFMSFFFPVFFGFILYNFPSGLVLYWMTNSILMITEHLLLRRRG